LQLEVSQQHARKHCDALVQGSSGVDKNALPEHSPRSTGSPVTTDFSNNIEVHVAAWNWSKCLLGPEAKEPD